MINRRALILGATGVAGAGLVFRSCQARNNWQAGTSSADIARAMPAARQNSGTDFKAVTTRQIPIGGGGFVTGIDASTDGQRLVCRTDVANAYVRNVGDRAWLPLFSPQTMAPQDYDPLPPLADKADGQGVAGVRIAPSNKDIIYASYHGYIWRSDDAGRTIRKTGSPQLSMLSNAGVQRLYNRLIDVDPRDPERVVVGTWGEGMWYSQDGGRSFQKAVLPAAGKSLDGRPGIHLVLCDNKVPGRTYVFVAGVGLHRSDQGPSGAFRLLGGGPIHASGMVQSSDGSIYLTEQTGSQSGGVWRVAADGEWKSGRPQYEVAAVAIDPRNPAKMIASNANGFIMTSDDSGLSWESKAGVKWDRRGGEIAWTRELNTFFPSEMLFDPAAPGRLLIAQGIGVAKAEEVSPALRVSDWSAGIEELCAVDILVPPTGKLFLSAWDKSFWRVDDRESYRNAPRYPVRKGAGTDVDLVAYGSYMDFAGDDPNFIVGVIAPTGTSAPGYSADAGDSWQAFEGTPPDGWGYGGCIAASTRSNIILLPSNNGVGAFTLDGGKSWASIKLDGTTPTGGFANSFFVKRQNITADKSRPGTFALVYTTIRNNDYAEPLGGLWITRDGGRSWSQQLKGVIAPGKTDPASVRSQNGDARQYWSCQLDYVPGRTGELVYTPHADFTDDRFYWSSDDGKSWSEIHKSIRNVVAFGFGKAASGRDRPALFFWGSVRGREGLYVSFDWGEREPQLMTRFPSQMLAKVESVAGDPLQLGRAYVGTSCAGWVQVDVLI